MRQALPAALRHDRRRAGRYREAADGCRPAHDRDWADRDEERLMPGLRTPPTRSRDLVGPPRRPCGVWPRTLRRKVAGRTARSQVLVDLAVLRRQLARMPGSSDAHGPRWSRSTESGCAISDERTSHQRGGSLLLQRASSWRPQRRASRHPSLRTTGSRSTSPSSLCTPGRRPSRPGTRRGPLGIAGWLQPTPTRRGRPLGRPALDPLNEAPRIGHEPAGGT